MGPTLAAADIATANLEGVISDRGVPAEKEFTFRGPPALLEGARRVAGIDVVTLANNHSVDYGPEALGDTLVAARRAGILTVGAGANATAARRAAYVRAGGLIVAFLGYSDVNPFGFTATSDRRGTAAASAEAIGEDVRAARRRADLVVVWFHWGTELHPEPDARQQMFAGAAIGAGADVVLGAHPHVLGAVTRPYPHRLIAWTLGNFVFPSASPGTRRTAILEVRLGARGVLGYRLVPAEAGVQPSLG